ncbi:hypothetical protein QCA50_007573 [Cerrena zonata]|uniref:Uncharacterized protein n=1 Tax=Cerrena zonata TaxID=2478898 RepID=A0AAW0G8X3_9APHY
MGNASLHVHPTLSVLPDLAFRVIQIAHLVLDLHSTNVPAALPVVLFSPAADAFLPAASHSFSIRHHPPVSLVTRAVRAALDLVQTIVWRVLAQARSYEVVLVYLAHVPPPQASFQDWVYAFRT